MIYLICYDIESDKVRKKVHDKLQAEGLERIQYSVFLGPISERRKPIMSNWLEDKVKRSDNPRDKICILQVQPSDLEKIELMGEYSLDIEMLTGKRNTLFF